MKKYFTPSSIPPCKPFLVKGSTLTIPNLAPSLLEIIAASSTDGFPFTSKPLFDESEQSGLSRLDVNQRDISQVYQFGKDELTKESEAKPIELEETQTETQID